MWCAGFLFGHSCFQLYRLNVHSTETSIPIAPNGYPSANDRTSLLPKTEGMIVFVCCYISALLSLRVEETQCTCYAEGTIKSNYCSLCKPTCSYIYSVVPGFLWPTPVFHLEILIFTCSEEKKRILLKEYSVSRREQEGHTMQASNGRKARASSKSRSQVERRASVYC